MADERSPTSRAFTWVSRNHPPTSAGLEETENTSGMDGERERTGNVAGNNNDSGAESNPPSGATTSARNNDAAPVPPPEMAEEMDFTLDDAQANDNNASAEQAREDRAAGYTQAERDAIGGLLFLTSGTNTDSRVIDEGMRRYRTVTPAPESMPTASRSTGRPPQLVNNSLNGATPWRLGSLREMSHLHSSGPYGTGLERRRPPGELAPIRDLVPPPRLQLQRPADNIGRLRGGAPPRLQPQGPANGAVPTQGQRQPRRPANNTVAIQGPGPRPQGPANTVAGQRPSPQPQGRANYALAIQTQPNQPHQPTLAMTERERRMLTTCLEQVRGNHSTTRHRACSCARERSGTRPSMTPLFRRR